MKKSQTEFLKLCLADSLLKLMANKPFDEININEICKMADVGRTTFYRHLDKNKGKEELLVFKLIYEWHSYLQKHPEISKNDLMLVFIYENRYFFKLLNDNNLILVIMEIFEYLMETKEIKGEERYITSFFTYGYFGIIYEWIKSDFKDTPEKLETVFKNAFNLNSNK